MKATMLFKLLVASIIPSFFSSQAVFTALDAMMRVKLESVIFMAIIDAKKLKKSAKRKKRKSKKKQPKNKRRKKKRQPKQRRSLRGSRMLR